MTNKTIIFDKYGISYPQELDLEYVMQILEKYVNVAIEDEKHRKEEITKK